MSTLALSDCLRATPSRTIAALLVELTRRVRRAACDAQAACTAASLNDRMLSDIGLSRTVLVHGV